MTITSNYVMHARSAIRGGDGKIRSQKKRVIFVIALIIFAGNVLNQDAGLSKVPEGLPRLGTVIPVFSIPVPPNEVYKSYLKLEGEGTFQPGDMEAKLVLIEVLNVHCVSCLYMAPYMNELYAKIEKDPELKGRVKMMGIGAGNDKWEIARNEGMYKFPIIPDEDYEFHNLVGAPATPFLIFAQPFGQGRLFVVDSHLGRLEDSDVLLSMVREASNTDISKLTATPEEKRVREGQADLVIPLSDSELMKKIRQSLAIMGEELNEIKKIELPNLGTVYAGILKKSKRPVFARVVARKIPCVDCHDVFFIYSFDDEGRFLQFVPISISKLYNEEWDEKDIRKIQNHFKGKSLLEDIPFHPKVDAVTSATISSKLIFDSISRTRLVIKKLIDLGYMVKGQNGGQVLNY